MEPATSIKRMGFRRWYERQLIDSHLSFVTCVLAIIAFAACLEAVRFEEFGWQPAALLAVVAASLPVAYFSWRRFMRILAQAERYGERSTCTACGTYGRLEVAQAGSSEIPREPGDTDVPRFEVWMRVRCRKCGHAWRMPDE
jgi:hypothetical protein